MAEKLPVIIGDWGDNPALHTLNQPFVPGEGMEP